MKSKTTSIRLTEALIEKCDKVAQELGMNRNQLFCVVMERVCDQFLEAVEKRNGEGSKQH